MSRGDRHAIELDGEWRFVADPEALYSPDGLPEGRPIQVPGVWEAQLEQPWRIINGWYRRRFESPAEWSGQHVLLRFGGVMFRCRAWLNGHFLGEHEGGYSPFDLSAGSALRAGGDEQNELVLQVTNPLNAIASYPAMSVEEVLRHQEREPELPLSEAPHGKQTWYASMSGPWRSIRAELVPASYIENLRLLPNARDGEVRARWRLAGEPAPGGTELSLAILDPDGREVARESRPLEAEQPAGEWRLAIPEAQLWDIGQPRLYQAVLTLAAGGVSEDVHSVRFGMRDIEVRDGRIMLNGRPIYLLAALDQDVYPDTIWTPPSREYLDEQLRLAREMGLNMLRCHIKVPDPAYVEAADEAGMLLWCELPNWSVFSPTSAQRGRQTLEAMVDELGNSPSIVIWTVINEDWGTELRERARDRHWLRQTVEWLRELDPTRLVVDNSACDTAHGPNFHLLSDLADFHVYYAMPDNAQRWRAAIEAFADRPSWLWSPHGDASPTGEEALVLSEFGNWGLPSPGRLLEHYDGREPWWFDTGRHYYHPRGMARRFRQLGLDRLWRDVDELAEATQWHQFDALHYEIGQLRRHASIQGYVITELTDAYWEANGLLDITRRPKAFHERLGRLNSPDVIVIDVERRDLWDDTPLRARLYLSSYGPRTGAGGRLAWRLWLTDSSTERSGEIKLDDWPDNTVLDIGQLEIELPAVGETTDARLELTAYDGEGNRRARDELRLALVPARRRGTDNPLRVAVHDPLDIWSIGRRLEQLGHQVVPADGDGPDLLVASELTDELLEEVEAGRPLLLLVRDRSALPEDLPLARPVRPQSRELSHPGWPGQHSPWAGDWISAFSWLRRGLPGAPQRPLLDFAYAEVLPDHVLVGYDPKRHRDEVMAGMFVGWLHAPAALLWSFPQGRGQLAATTLRLAPEGGPVASVLFEGLLQQLAAEKKGTAQLAEVHG